VAAPRGLSSECYVSEVVVIVCNYWFEPCFCRRRSSSDSPHYFRLPVDSVTPPSIIHLVYDIVHQMYYWWRRRDSNPRPHFLFVMYQRIMVCWQKVRHHRPDRCRRCQKCHLQQLHHLQHLPLQLLQPRPLLILLQSVQLLP